MTNALVEIYDIMACNVLMDFENISLRKEQHKFLVAFYPTGGAPIPELVEKITARGPGGYNVEFQNQRFTPANRNGHIYDRTTNSHWYMVNLDTGFMKEGEYTIEVKCKDGGVKTRARTQNNAPSDRLVSAYVHYKQKIYDSYWPGNGAKLPPGTDLKEIEVKCTSLKELAGQDAFYIFRLSEGKSSKEFDTQNLVWWDNIFLQGVGDAAAGLNREKIVITTELKPDTSYVYFTEITDSNVMGKTNICIFQPHQIFHT